MPITQRSPFQRVELPAEVVKPPEDVFLFAEAQAKAQARDLTAEFTAALGAVQLANLTAEEVVAYIRDEDPGPAVLWMVTECLEVAAGA